MRIRRNDLVVVITGDSSGATPRKVVGIVDGGAKLVVEGVGRVIKHVRRGHPKSPQGGRLQVDSAINASNVALYCQACNSGVKVGARFRDDGSKERYCRKCSGSLGTISPPRAAHAKKS